MPRYPSSLAEVAWKSDVLEGEREELVQKDFIAEVTKAATGDRKLSFVISTDDVDRHGDVVSVDGWELAEYRKNPVVLWQHDPGQGPIARASNVRVEDGKLKADATFADRETSELADMAYRLYVGDFMRAVSVGFRIVEWKVNEDRAGWMPMDITRAELWEFSAVSIPANPNALIEAREAGIDTTPAMRWAMRTLDYGHHPPEVRAWLEKTWKAAGNGGRVAFTPRQRSLGGLVLDVDVNLEQASAEIERVSARAKEVSAELDELHEKAGRVLSQKNYDKLTEARDAISDVLASAEENEDKSGAAVLEIID